ncbi:IQ domain-containing protein K-like [Pararge aegeria]|uniref:Jg25877 protein n=1 Tax=Pararge aegeria aegeria TaxID=348720 RepID=A0A8S4RT88_9NEOP|nr:IQ domain-containing protein K-like [Pararge aegeria]CAH2240335.1 jg25877 [Pararge aegeria aegeria]
MAGKASDRKGKSGKDAKSAANEKSETVTAFTLPDSLPCSEIDFPLLIRKRHTANWNEIVEESNNNYKEIEEYAQSKREVTPKPPFQKTECDYIANEVYVYLIPALEETLNKAVIWDALKIQKCFFNGIDHIAQLLWNNNPRHPYRKLNNCYLFNMPWVREFLKKNPRPYYPKSWLWPEEYAATLIQKTVRQYFVQREEEVQEMRDFWKKLEVEQNLPEMDINPYLAKKFASQHVFTKK